MDLMLAEESTFNKLAPPLEKLLTNFDDKATHHDYFVALLIVLFTESGFYLPPKNSSNSFPVQKRFCELKIEKSEKTKVYDMVFNYNDNPNLQCKLVAIPSGDSIIINAYPLIDERKTYNMIVQPLLYVNPYSSNTAGKYFGLKNICYKIKDTVITPVRSDLLLDAGRVCPCFQGLPDEVKQIIWNYASTS